MSDKERADQLEKEKADLLKELNETKDKLIKAMSDTKPDISAEVSLPTVGERSQVLEMMKKLDDAETEKAIVDIIKKLTAQEAEDPTLARAITSLQTDGTAVSSRNLAMANKITSKIPKFGISPGYKWDQLVAHLQMTQKRNVYTEDEMKLILQDALEGPAFEYIQANQHIFDQSYADALGVLNDVFGKTRAQAMNELQSITQQPKETVELFAARLLNAAEALKPEIPSLMHVVIVDGKRTFKENPNYRAEHSSYRGRLQMLDEMYVTYLVNGLRAEIRRQMRAEDYKTFADARLAARTAERFLNHLATPSIVAGVEVQQTPTQVLMAQATATRNEGLEVNASYPEARGQLKKMEGGRKKEKRDFSKIRCYRCQGLGHIATNCNARIRVDSPYREAATKYFDDDSAQSGGIERSGSSRSGSPAQGIGFKGPRVAFGGSGKPRGRSPGRKSDNYKRDCSNCRRRGRSCSYHQRKARANFSNRRKVYYINDDGTYEEVSDESKNE